MMMFVSTLCSFALCVGVLLYLVVLLTQAFGKRSSPKVCHVATLQQYSVRRAQQQQSQKNELESMLMMMTTTMTSESAT